MTNIFLDLGTHYGQGLREFINRFDMNEEWEIHTFEANPLTYEIFKNNYHKENPWVIAHNEAVSDHNGEITVNLETPHGESATGMGSSVIDLSIWNPWGGELRENFKSQAVVPCMDLSEFILTNYTLNNKIIIKMDIEGSEYDTLEKMIVAGALNYVDHISVEWHSRMFVNKEEILAREQRIRKYMIDNQINLEDWR